MNAKAHLKHTIMSTPTNTETATLHKRYEKNIKNETKIIKGKIFD
jgi:hypothetical protein